MLLELNIRNIALIERLRGLDTSYRVRLLLP